MVDKTLSQIRTDNAAVAPTGAEPIESVQSATSAAFTFGELSNHPLNPQTGTAYTLVLTDQGKAVTMSNAAANILTIPLNSSVAFHIGTKLLVRQIGAGGTTVVGDGGVTVELDANASLVMDGAQQQILLHKTATDTWHAAPVVAISDIDLALFINGAPENLEKIATFVVTRAFTLASGLTDTQAYAEVTATSNATIDLHKNGGASLGTIDFASATNVATFTFSTLTSFAVGDRLNLVNQSTADATLADISITIRGVLT